MTNSGENVMANVNVLRKKGNERMLREKGSVLRNKSDRPLDIFTYISM